MLLHARRTNLGFQSWGHFQSLSFWIPNLKLVLLSLFFASLHIYALPLPLSVIYHDIINHPKTSWLKITALFADDSAIWPQLAGAVWSLSYSRDHLGNPQDEWPRMALFKCLVVGWGCWRSSISEKSPGFSHWASSADVPLAKARLTGKPRVSVGGDRVRTWTPGTLICWD